MAREKQFENKLKNWLEEQGIHRIGQYHKGDCGWYLKFYGGGNIMPNGIPDLLIVINGKFLAIEVKSDTGQLSELQKDKMKQINETGGYALCVRPQNEMEFRNAIQLLKNQCVQRL